MASLTTIALVDDLDGGKAAETVSFGIDGVAYEIDLNTKNAKALRKALAEFTDVARPVKPPRPASLVQLRGRRAGRASLLRESREITTAIRSWAMEQGIEVAERGRISADVRAQYEAAPQA